MWGLTVWPRTKGHRIQMPEIDPRALFPDFYANSAIATLAPAARWTISGSLADDPDDPDDPRAGRKAPIDIRQLLDGHDIAGKRLRGAWARDEQCLITLADLTQRIPNAANAAFYLQAATDGLIIIDVEPSCPPEIAANLINLPGLLYTEVSMSGRGYHLIAALPRSFHNHPMAAGKRVLRHAQGWYEILLDHWVTFTRQPIETWPAPNSQGVASVDELYTELAAVATAVSNASGADVRTAAEPPEIPHGRQIVLQTVNASLDKLKEPAEFDYDNSRWEYSVLATLYIRMDTPMGLYSSFDGSVYSDSDQAWLLYLASLEVLPHRRKHNEMRNRRPYLLDRAASIIAGRR